MSWRGLFFRLGGFFGGSLRGGGFFALQVGEAAFLFDEFVVLFAHRFWKLGREDAAACRGSGGGFVFRGGFFVGDFLGFGGVHVLDFLAGFLEFLDGLAESLGEIGEFPRAEEEDDDGKNDYEVQGAENIRRLRPDATFIFTAPSEFAALERRLKSRNTNTEEEIAARLERARVEYAAAVIYDYVIINDDLSTAVSELLAIITAQRCKVKNRLHIMQIS